ncbi:glutaminase [Planomicrobium sp. YIM 101495]|uniref:glutaminase n=1 Tax=Planomicrobium sp. YIM 101495 TaxID=2665160 RepID=UPI0012B905A7|nr:glutaminase [Planomicrobium sp. YIM 101495]MTD30967.1 glutaminase [Planomicrobium sp. YIM 101495]
MQNNPHIQEQLEKWVEENRGHVVLGTTAQYIPALGNEDPAQLGICMIDEEGNYYAAGDTEKEFTLQSVSKALSFIAVCCHYGLDYVLERVDVEPTGEAFNSIIPFEIHRPNKPFNPFINAGAITVSALLPGQTPQKKFQFLLEFLEKLVGHPLEMDQEVYDSEWQTSHRNRALAYYLKEANFLDIEVEEALDIYISQCAIKINVKDLALIGLIIGYDGYNPITKERHFSDDIAQVVKVLMVTCGMYNSSGNFAAHVGIPAKSGVSGGILAAVPPKLHSQTYAFRAGAGIGVYGPAIDVQGNSAAGTMMLKQISKEWDLSIF